MGTRLKRLAAAVALVGEKAEAAGAGAAMTGDIGWVGIGHAGGLLRHALAPQFVHAGADRLEIVCGARLRHQTLRLSH